MSYVPQPEEQSMLFPLCVWTVSA